MKVDREGTFKAVAFFQGFQKANDPKSRSFALRLRCDLQEYQDPSGWVPWADYQQEVEYAAWIRKRDGSFNDQAAENLMNVFGWNGDLNTLQEGQELGWCQVVVEYEADNREGHQHKKYLKAKFLNEIGGKASNVVAPAPAEVKEATMTLGPQLRALAANVKRNKPPAPPVQAPQVAAAPVAEADDDPPF